MSQQTSNIQYGRHFLCVTRKFFSRKLLVVFLVVRLHANFYVPSSSRYEVTGAQSLNFILHANLLCWWQGYVYFSDLRGDYCTDCKKFGIKS